MSTDPDMIFYKMMLPIGVIPSKVAVGKMPVGEDREYLEALHRRASNVCPICKKTIGYKLGYYQKKDDDTNTIFLVHDGCDTQWYNRKGTLHEHWSLDCMD